MQLARERLEAYIRARFGADARLRAVQAEQAAGGSEGLKAFGYGVPLRLTVEANGQLRELILSCQRPDARFGHDHIADRAQEMLWQHAAYGTLPRHVASLDVGYIRENGELVSVAEAVEFFLLRERLPGEPYWADLDRIASSMTVTALDRDRVDALADYLAGIHQKRRDAPALYRRRIRDTIAHGEGIFGIVDASPEPLPVPPERLARIEEACVRWRWRLRGLTHRLATVHGDFHPWNILFWEGAEFGLLDRSRGEWGEPADDVAALSINYLFFSLARCGGLAPPFAELFARFFDRYLGKSGDTEIGRTLPLFYAFRGLVVASPVWYPDLTPECRERLFRFVERVLEVEVFRPGEIGRLLEA